MIYVVHLFSAVQANTCDINRGMRDALVVPTTDLNEHNINHCLSKYVSKLQYQVPYGAIKELCKQ